MPDTDAGKCAGSGGPAGFDGVADVSSHALVEAVTDRCNGTGWYASAVPNNDPNNCGAKEGSNAFGCVRIRNTC